MAVEQVITVSRISQEIFNIEQNTGKTVSHSCVEHDRLTVFICLNHFRKLDLSPIN
ncbi:hypothetical protein bcgnr5371_15650 [Bacillus cereus]